MVSNTEVFTHPFAEGIIAPHFHGINEAAALLRSSRVLSVDAHVAIGFHRRYVQNCCSSLEVPAIAASSSLVVPSIAERIVSTGLETITLDVVTAAQWIM